MTTNKFYTRCYIKKNTVELRHKLFKIGYVAKSDDDGWNILCENGEFRTVKAISEKERNTYIDCGVKEKLFLALAALRHDSDFMQEFIACKMLILFSKNEVGKFKCIYPGDFFQCGKQNVSELKILGIRLPGEDYVYWRKATEEELIDKL